MAEKGLTIKDQAGGRSIACRTAYELNETNDSRIFQIVDRSSKQIIHPIGLPIRNAVLVSDGLDLSNLPSELTNNLITCGDKHTLVCCVEFLDLTASQTCKILPILYDNEISPGIIAVIGSSNSSISALYQSNQGNKRLAAVKSWDITGAYKVGLYINYLDLKGGSNGVNIWGFMV